MRTLFTLDKCYALFVIPANVDVVFLDVVFVCVGNGVFVGIGLVFGQNAGPDRYFIPGTERSLQSDKRRQS